MLIWFAACSVVLVALVFKSPGVDYRWVALGSILPLAEAVLGGPRLLHSALGAAAVFALIVVATRRRRLLRRELLGLPIGMAFHLVLDGSFTRSSVFWWPLGHRASGQVPELRHLGPSLVLELVGLAVAAWAYRWFHLDDPARRQRFLRQGRLDLPEPT